MRAVEFLLETEQRQMEPELYEEVPNSILKRAVQAAMPGVQLRFRTTPEGYLNVTDDEESFRLDIGMSIYDSDLGFNIENAYLTKYAKGGVMTNIIANAFALAEKKYGIPRSRSLNIEQDRSYGVWQHIANKLGLEYAAHQIGESAESTNIPAEDVLAYVTSIHNDFHLPDTILTHPKWRKTRVPLNRLHVPDPESGEDLDDPYNRVQMIDMYHVDDITRQDIERRPIVVDTDGHIIDGNHRALAARLGGLFDVPAYVPVAVNENFSDGKVKGRSRPGRVKRAGASCNGSVTSLRQKAKNASGERAKMYHWCANMKSGRNKK